MTQKQAEAVAKMLVNWDRPRSISFRHKPFELPIGYIGFTLTLESGNTIDGGIDSEGKVST